MRRKLRDNVFEDVMNIAFGQFGQFEKLRQWIYEELDDCKCFTRGLEPCTHSNQSRVAIENANDQLGKIEKQFNKLLEVEEEVEKESDLAVHESVERGFETISKRVMPLIRDLFRIRTELESLFEATP
ncbi:MAG: hypothetical protein ACRECH_14595 [Nitrososphaerales archaeon]